LVPLHGEKSGLLMCPICAGSWHAEHGKKPGAGQEHHMRQNAFEAFVCLSTSVLIAWTMLSI
jgi:hypothetical protein